MAETHYHVTGYWADDSEDAYRPMTLAEANDEMADRADLFADHEAETAHIMLDMAENVDNTGEWAECVPCEYRDAARAFRAVETYSALAHNNRRFADYPLADNEDSRKFSLGLIPGANGTYYVDTGKLEAYECADPQCERDWAEFVATEDSYL
jgi:hypothetical protein